MGIQSSQDFSQRQPSTESAVHSTALAYRFMLRRTLCQRGGAQFRAEDGALKTTDTRPGVRRRRTGFNDVP